MDDADRAQKDMDFLAEHRKKPETKEANETGYCLFCGEPVPKGHRWCDADCRNLWEAEKRRENHYIMFR